MRPSSAGLVAAMLALTPLVLHAQSSVDGAQACASWPTRFVVPFGPGSASDVLACTAGQAKFPIGQWFALFGPAGLRPELVARMNKEMVVVLAKPGVKDAMLRQGFLARSSTPAALAAYMKEQLAAWKLALKIAGVEPQ